MSIRRLKINLPGAPYEVRIGKGATERLGEYLRSVNASTKAVIVADSEVATSYGPLLRTSLESASYTVSDLTVPHGEASKDLEVALELYRALAMLGIGRSDLIVGLGGGVIGDLSAFVAATYMRGVAYVGIPTTLLAMVDASVGGKNGVNLPEGKNLVGTFKQPIHVTVDTDFLVTLPQREWTCGLGEVAKTGIIGTDVFYAWLCDNVENLVAHDEVAVADCIAQCIAFKADVVIHDERETSGIRECLNYGHTFGHALEAVAGYGVYSHGQAVAEGMRFAARLAAQLLGTEVDFVREQDDLLDALGLGEIAGDFDAGALLLAMHADKKAQSGTIRFVLPKQQGKWELVPVEDTVISEHLSAWCTARKAAEI